MTQPVQLSNHEDAGRALRNIVDLIEQQILAPHSIDLWTHRVAGRDLVTVADHYETPIRVSYMADGITPTQATVTATLATRHANGVQIKAAWISTDVEDGDLRIYNLHNTECLGDK
jgi:hypothetical protein